MVRVDKVADGNKTNSMAKFNTVADENMINSQKATRMQVLTWWLMITTLT